MSNSREEIREEIAKLRNSDERMCRTKSGTDLTLEEMADVLLADSRRGIVKHSELRDWLSPSQLDLRWRREVYPKSGVPESHLFSGIYGRAYNPKSRGTTSSKMSPGDLEEA